MNSTSKLTQDKIKSNKQESNNILKNIKSKFILQIIFNNLLKKKSLYIIKYNNNLKNRLNISIKDYKEYSAKKYSSIEIEIKTVNNKYGKFINIDKANEMYYHIYFNDNKNEIKRNYFDEDDNVEKLKIIIDYQIKSFEGLFDDCKTIEYIYFKKFYRTNITNMKKMFFKCTELKELDLSNFNTNNVRDMVGMFSKCSKLRELNLSNFNTNNVRNMRYMFNACASLKELNLSNFNTNKVTIWEVCSLNVLH